MGADICMYVNQSTIVCPVPSAFRPVNIGVLAILVNRVLDQAGLNQAIIRNVC